MSVSEAVHAAKELLARDPVSRAAATELLSEDATVSQADLSALLSVAIKLYTALSPEPYGDDALRNLTVTPTEACTVATALLHSQSLSPFEFAVWFSSSGR